MLTSRDVAKALGIAQSTVSRAFTPGAPISAELRTRIHETSARIGYRPNLLARGLIADRSHLIGVVLAPQTNLLYPELLYELSVALAERGYQILLFPAATADAAARAVDMLHAYRVDAVLATGVIGDEQARAFAPANIPLVMFNRVVSEVASVSCDFAAGAADLTCRLLKAGHSSFGFIGGPSESYVSAQVASSVRRALDEAGAEFTAVAADYRYDSAAPAFDALEAGAKRSPTAVVCVNDTVAAGCLDHLRVTLRRRVPEDVAMVAFESFGPAEWAGYQLTGMRQPMAQMINAAVELLLARVEQPDLSAEQRLFAPVFVAGATGGSLG